MRLSFFADMGGFKLQFSDGKQQDFGSGLDFYEWFAKREERPSQLDFKEIELDIKDRSKSNGVLKVFTCMQATWLLVETVVRFAQHQPVSELEVTTCAYIVCALVVYSCWLHKPYGVGRRITIHLDSNCEKERPALPEGVKLPIAPFRGSNSSLFNSSYNDPDKAILGTLYFSAL